MYFYCCSFIFGIFLQFYYLFFSCTIFIFLSVFNYFHYFSFFFLRFSFILTVSILFTFLIYFRVFNILLLFPCISTFVCISSAFLHVYFFIYVYCFSPAIYDVPLSLGVFMLRLTCVSFIYTVFHVCLLSLFYLYCLPAVLIVFLYFDC